MYIAINTLEPLMNSYDFEEIVFFFVYIFYEEYHAFINTIKLFRIPLNSRLVVRD